MPSQEEYLDNLLKGIGNTTDDQNEEIPSEESVAAAAEPESKSKAEKETIPQIDMSDMDELLQSALEAQQEDTKQNQPDKSDVIHPEETSSMSEDEIDRLLQNSREQAEDDAEQETQDSNDDLIKMLEDADDEGLSSILDQVTPESAKEETTEESGENQGVDSESDGNKRKKKKKEKDKKEKKQGLFARFHKKSKEEAESAQESADTVGEDTESASETKNSISDLEERNESAQETPDTVRLSNDMTQDGDGVSWESLDSDGNSTDTGTEVSGNNTDSVGDNGIVDDDLDALLAGAFPEKATEDSDTSEPADVMDILKAAGADIVEEPEQKKEKKGFFAKIFDLFTEEDEDEEDAGQIQLSDENKKILDEMDKDKKKKGKKEKKQKKEKAPKAKKPAKEKKKKEKPSKNENNSVPEKKLSPKKVIPIVVVCLTLGAVILLVGNFLTEYMTRRSGRKAYYAGDYQTCYQDLFGKDLNETEQIMYSKSESILTIRMWLREYDVFVNEGSELEALDSLLQAVHDYPSLLTYATEWNAQDEVTVAFQDILNILSQKYQLSQEEAQSIADISDDVEYTQNVMRILQNLGLGSWELPEGITVTPDQEQTTEEPEVQLPDPLPEESAVLQ